MRGGGLGKDGLPSGAFAQETLYLKFASAHPDADLRPLRRLPRGAEAHRDARGPEGSGKPAHEEGVGHHGLAEAHDARFEDGAREGRVGRGRAQKTVHGRGEVGRAGGAYLAGCAPRTTVPFRADRVVENACGRVREGRRRKILPGGRREDGLEGDRAGGDGANPAGVLSGEERYGRRGAWYLRLAGDALLAVSGPQRAALSPVGAVCCGATPLLSAPSFLVRWRSLAA